MIILVTYRQVFVRRMAHSYINKNKIKKIVTYGQGVEGRMADWAFFIPVLMSTLHVLKQRNPR